MRRPCIEPDCKQTGVGARCPRHTKQQGRAKNNRRRTLAPPNGAGAQTRRAINRAGYGGCAKCGGTFAASAVEVDHITPLSQGGPDTWENIQVLCSGCHHTKNAAETTARATRS